MYSKTENSSDKREHYGILKEKFKPKTKNHNSVGINQALDRLQCTHIDC